MYREQLGLSYDADERAIKRAYAALAKKCNPEEEPEQWEKLHTIYKEALAEARGESKADVPDAETACGTQDTPMTVGEVSRLMLRDIKMLTEKKCTDEEQWNRIFATYEFDDMIAKTDFRIKARDILFGAQFPESTAKLIAAAFGGDSTSFRVTYPNEMWGVSISENIIPAGTQKDIITDDPANSQYAVMYSRSEERKGSCFVTALKIVAVMGLVFIGLYALLLFLVLFI